MIVAETPDAYRFVTQPEHGAQVGRFAEAWGNERFAAPTPRAPVLMAAALHDAGWYDYDLAPHLVDGEPASVLDTGREAWTAFYERGIRNVTERDPYAGLLCSMHGAGVRRRRYGTHADLPDSSDAFATFVREQESTQRTLVDRLVDAGRVDHVDERDRTALSRLHDETLPDGESGVFRNYRLLQTWDRLSLYCCTTVDHAPTTIGSVPVARGEPDAELAIEPRGDGTVALDPFPFGTALLSAPVRARTVRRDAVEAGDEQDLVRAYYAAPMERVEFSFVPRGN
jgi:hypothetical protein